MASATQADGFVALADPTRRRIIAMLAEGDLTVKQIAAEFPISRPAISKHLRVLRNSGLVTEQKCGRERLQRFDGGALQPVAEWIAHYEVFWKRRLETLKRIVEEET